MLINKHRTLVEVTTITRMCAEFAYLVKEEYCTEMDVLGILSDFSLHGFWHKLEQMIQLRLFTCHHIDDVAYCF